LPSRHKTLEREGKGSKGKGKSRDFQGKTQVHEPESWSELRVVPLLEVQVEENDAHEERSLNSYWLYRTS
jgi:hypothetical protein